MGQNVRTLTLQELSDLVAAELLGDPACLISGVNALDCASSSEASFLANPRYKEAMQHSKAGVICIDRNTSPIAGKNFLISDDPSRSFQKIVEFFCGLQRPSAFTGIHPTAVIATGVVLGHDVSIGPYVVIDAAAQIGDRTVIGAHVYVGMEVVVGSDCRLDPSCVIRERCRIGHRVVIQSGAVIGSCGFGYTTDSKGCHHKLEQLGIVIIEDDVDIGANTTIDRARFGATIIGHGTKIDNLVQIAHNVQIGPYNLIAAQVGIAGSVKTGHHVVMGGQVGVAGHLTLENYVMIGAQSGISKSLKSGKYRGSPALPVNEYQRQEVHVRRLSEYMDQIRQSKTK